jgi:hypothetical protein
LNQDESAMMIVQNFVAASPIHGVGLYCGEDLEAGRVVYVFDPAVDIRMDRQQIQAKGPMFARFMRIFAYEDLDHGHLYISVDNSKFMNHSENPNTLWDREKGWTCRPIAKGEELTCDYYTFWRDPPLPGAMDWPDLTRS